MKFPFVLLCDPQQLLFNRVRGDLISAPWALRVEQDVEACRASLRRLIPDVLVLRLGNAPEEGLEMLDWLQARGAATRSIVILASADSELEALAWNLGAATVLHREAVQTLPATITALVWGVH